MRHTLRHRLLIPLIALIALPACGSSEDSQEQASSSISLVAIPDRASVRVGGSTKFEVRMLRGDGSRDPVPQAEWRSNDPSIATIDTVTGEAKGVAAGTVGLEAHYGPGTAFATLEVLP